MRALGIVAALLVLGCASMNQRCLYREDGSLSYVRTRSTVLGTGETELVSNACADLAYSTRDTGISDNGRATLLGLGQLAADGATGGATAALRRVDE